MSVWTALVSFAVVAGFLTLVPGLDTALVLRSAIVRGTRTAFTTALGVGSGLLVWGIATTCGLSVLLTTSQWAYTVLRIAGAIYLIWLGLTSLVALLRSGDLGAGQFDDRAVANGSLLRAWARGATSNLLNPKVGVFYIAMLPQFIPPHAPHLLMGTALTLIHFVEGVLWSTVLICGVRFTKSWLDRPSVKRWMEALTGSVLVALGLKLALDSP
ncbi:LysE family translocator [Nocardia sp. XZ_19_369]|uniref:LysE family translocator n=1 Tax=Nocardia sp. XZ_19_369 TaxID=2769487 RepID=UPI001890644C|nr:LysE family translocator [Nocardia sp. XZ_19_369]